MGQRELLVSPELFIEFFKKWNDLARINIVTDDALPDDAKFVEVLFKANNTMALVLESEEWTGRSEIPLPPPQVMVRYLANTENHCKDCKWWGNTTNPFLEAREGWELCRRIVEDGCLAEPNDSMADYIMAAPNYGCVQFEPKEPTNV